MTLLCFLLCFSALCVFVQTETNNIKWPNFSSYKNEFNIYLFISRENVYSSVSFICMWIKRELRCVSGCDLYHHFRWIWALESTLGLALDPMICYGGHHSNQRQWNQKHRLVDGVSSIMSNIVNIIEIQIQLKNLFLFVTPSWIITYDSFKPPQYSKLMISLAYHLETTHINTNAKKFKCELMTSLWRHFW